MEETKMNTRLGTKWFTFYAKVRPWFACVSVLAILVDFFQYIEVYLTYWWMLLYFAVGITQAVLSIMVFVKARGDYANFVRFVKGVLIFEAISMAYSVGIQYYLRSFNVGIAILLVAIFFVAGYFLWFRLNIKYFEKRMPTKPLKEAKFGFASSETPKAFGKNKAYDEEMTRDFENKNEAVDDACLFSNVHYCRKCGSKLLEDSLFCSRCGTKVIFETEETVIREAEEKARREAEEKARRESEERARREDETRSTREVEKEAKSGEEYDEKLDFSSVGNIMREAEKEEKIDFSSIENIYAGAKKKR